MVRIGFICEGKTERKIVESESFRKILSAIGIECIKPVIDAKGSGNLLPENLKESLSSLKEKGADKVVILTDLDEDKCITLTKERIGSNSNLLVIVAVKKIESWFLADSKTLSLLLNQEDFYFESPESEQTPFDTIKAIFVKEQGRGIGVKDIFTARMLKYGFSVESAASHPNCKSAAYFLKVLNELVR